MLCELRVNQPSVYPLPGVGRVIGDFTLPQFSTPLSLFCWSMILAIISFFVTNDVCLVKKGKNCLVFLFIYFYFYFYFISVSQCTCDWISVYGHLWPAAGWKRPAWRLGSIALRERKRRIRLFRNPGGAESDSWNWTRDAHVRRKSPCAFLYFLLGSWRLFRYAGERSCLLGCGLATLMRQVSRDGTR